MANQRISALVEDATPSTSDVVPIDGATTRKATIANIVNSGRPFASQAEAEAGTAPDKAMSPLTTKQAITAIGGSLFATAGQGTKADSAVQPGSLAAVATSGAYGDLSGKPTLGTAAATDSTAYAAAAEKVPAGGLVGQVLAKVTSTDNDVHWQNAGAGDVLSGNNLSDLANTATARTNLGLGNSATKNVGTSAGTVAAGDDSRITGAVRSDIAQSLTYVQRKQAIGNLDLTLAIPENYGENVGTGDPYTGGNDDSAAITACLAANGVCLLDPRKEYWVASNMVLSPGDIVAAIGGKARINYTTDPATRYMGGAVFKLQQDCELHDIFINAQYCFYGVWITHGNNQVIRNVDIQRAYGNCLCIAPDELITNGAFNSDLSGWTITNATGNTVTQNTGAMQFSITNGSAYAFATIPVTCVIGFSYVVFVDNVGGTGVLCQVGTTANGAETLAPQSLDSGQDAQQVTGRSYFTFISTATTHYVTFKCATIGTARIDNVFCEEAGPATGLVYDGGILFTEAQDGTVGKYAGIFLPSREPTIAGLRRFENLNGVGTVLFDLQGSNLTQMINCYQAIGNYQFSTWSMPPAATFPIIEGGRFACPIDVYSTNWCIDDCTIGETVTVYAQGARGVITDSNRLSGLTLALGAAGNTIHWRPNMGTLDDQSNGANIILGLPPGGTVIQATSKSTGVTLNKRTGMITMNNAALAAGAAVTFIVTNSNITANDSIIANHAQNGTAGAYAVEANFITAGSFKLTVRNVTGGSLSEGIVISFTAIRGATS